MISSCDYVMNRSVKDDDICTVSDFLSSHTNTNTRPCKHSFIPRSVIPRGDQGIQFAVYVTLGVYSFIFTLLSGCCCLQTFSLTSF